ncbi:hypothetical protein D8T30_04205 [Vibrio vulnificus]|nr:hypothetical protein CRN42_06840 [Vibrio vulnificus]RZQ77493.1 hypothetical protein D8T30_04205 [Vibrio vulnificus]
MLVFIEPFQAGIPTGFFSSLDLSGVNRLELICNCEVNYIYRDNKNASLEVIFILFYILNGNLSIILSERRPDREKSVLI